MIRHPGVLIKVIDTNSYTFRNVNLKKLKDMWPTWLDKLISNLSMFLS